MAGIAEFVQLLGTHCPVLVKRCSGLIHSHFITPTPTGKRATSKGKGTTQN